MRNETAIQSLQHIYKARGLSGFWIGLQPRLFEACTKGAILVYSREVLLSCCGRIGVRGAAAAALSGMGSGVAQTVVMGPATLLVVAANDAASTGREHGGLLGAVRAIHSERGIAGFAAGAGPMALRQASNWGSRQFISEALRGALLRRRAAPSLRLWEEVLCGTAAGALSTWNQPFEVLRVRQQSAACRPAGRAPLSVQVRVCVCALLCGL